MLVFIGLGSNLENPSQQVETAIADINELVDTKLIKRSSLYKSPPMGPQDQPDYINAVVGIDTKLSPHQLLDNLQQIEQKHGRVRNRRWGQRTLDLDILVYGNETIIDKRLKIPHPGIPERAFVLYPLAEIDGSLTIPTMGLVTTMVEQCADVGIQKVGNNIS